MPGGGGGWVLGIIVLARFRKEIKGPIRGFLSVNLLCGFNKFEFLRKRGSGFPLPSSDPLLDPRMVSSSITNCGWRKNCSYFCLIINPISHYETESKWFLTTLLTFWDQFHKHDPVQCVRKISLISGRVIKCKENNV